MMMLIFTLIFSRIANFPSEGFDYPVFVFAGLIPWTLFSQGFAQSALSLVNQHNLLTKVYFPRLFVPTAAAAVFLVDADRRSWYLRVPSDVLPRRAELDGHLRTPADCADIHRHDERRLDAVGPHGVLSRFPAHHSVPVRRSYYT